MQQQVLVGIEDHEAVVNQVLLSGPMTAGGPAFEVQGIAVPAHGPVGVLAVWAQWTAAFAGVVAALVA
jgi:hypothetical protein